MASPRIEMRNGERELPELNNFSQLTRLAEDFGLQVIQDFDDDDSPGFGFSLVKGDGSFDKPHPGEFLTPIMPSLNALESYVSHNMTDLLHDYLFGDCAEQEEFALIE